MKVILIHGKNTDPSKKWYPWLAEEMVKRKVNFEAPYLPDAENPQLDRWIEEIEKTNPDEEAVLIGHSRGGVAVLRWLETLQVGRKVRKVILIATNSGDRSKMPIPTESNYGFYTDQGYDFEKIKTHCSEFVVFHSRDDQWVPFAAGEENAAGLNARFLKFDSMGHFGTGVSEIPELSAEILS